MFDHAILDFKDFPATTTPEGRVYHIGDKNYPSVTTFLTATKDKESLKGWEDWCRKEGKDPEAIKADAADRGEKLHQLCECYIRQDGYESLRAALPYRVVQLFDQLRPKLHRIEKVLALENVLYSHELKLAGRVDCVAVIEGVPTIVDFKSSTKLKFGPEVEDYKHQVTVYSMMMYSMFKLKCPNYQIMIASEVGLPTIVKGQVKDHYADVMKRIKLFRTK